MTSSGVVCVFLIGVTIFALASATIGFAPTDGWLVASRALQGVGAALMMPGTLSIITNAFPAARARQGDRHLGRRVGDRPRASGRCVGGWLTEDVSWRAIFFLNLPVAAGAIVVTLFAAEESRDETVDRRIDYPGIAALTVGLAALVLGARRGQLVGLGLAADPRRCSRSRSSRSIAFVRSSSAPRRRSWTSCSSARGSSSAPTSWPSWSRSRCSRCSSSSRSTCRTSSATARSRPACASSPRTLLVMVAGPDLRAADRPCRPALADDRRPAARSPLRCCGSRASTVDTSYGYLLPAFMVMGLGIGLVMSPMSTAAMNAVDRSEGRRRLGHAVDGPHGRRHVRRRRARRADRHGRPLRPRSSRCPGCPSRCASGSSTGLGSGAGAAPARPGTCTTAVNSAFVDALGTGLLVSAAAALIAALLSWALIRGAPSAGSGRAGGKRGRRAAGRVGLARSRVVVVYAQATTTPASRRVPEGREPVGDRHARSRRGAAHGRHLVPVGGRPRAREHGLDAQAARVPASGRAGVADRPRPRRPGTSR